MKEMLESKGIISFIVVVLAFVFINSVGDISLEENEHKVQDPNIELNVN